MLCDHMRRAASRSLPTLLFDEILSNLNQAYSQSLWAQYLGQVL